MPYLILTLAIVAETIGTTALQASQQFTRLGPTVLAIVARVDVAFVVVHHIFRMTTVIIGAPRSSTKTLSRRTRRPSASRDVPRINAPSTTRS